MTEQKKEILYELASLQERNTKNGEALSLFKKILEADINYRDVRARIERLSASA